MLITNDQEVERIIDANHEMQDGLFAIVGQRYMIEMTRYDSSITEIWVVEEYNLREEEENIDTLYNPSYVTGESLGNTSLLGLFKRDARYAYTTREEAFKHFTDYQFVRNHF